MTNEEILNAIEQLKTGKSGDDYMFINECFIYDKYILLSNLHKIFNLIFT